MGSRGGARPRGRSWRGHISSYSPASGWSSSHLGCPPQYGGGCREWHATAMPGYTPPPERQILLLDHIRLEAHRTLASYNVGAGAVLRLSTQLRGGRQAGPSGRQVGTTAQNGGPSAAQIFVETVQGTPWSLTASLAEGAAQIKTFVRDRQGVPATWQRLLFEGHALEEDRSLADVGVGRGATIRLTYRLRGGLGCKDPRG